MTTEQKVALRKLSLLELAQDLGNVSKACRVMGYSRQQFYEIRRNFQLYGAEGLIDRLPGPKHPHPNRVSQEIVWSRHDLLSRHQRLMRLERETRDRKLELTEDQIRLLERFSPEFRERHILTRGTGDLVAVDTFFVGTLKGIGKVYLQTVIDCFSRHAWAQLHTSKMPVTAVHILNNHVLPFFEAAGGTISTILSDNGREFCGRPDQHPYELFLQLEGIEHRTTRVRRPQSNGFIERFHRTLLDEHFRVVGRTKWYETVEEMQKDLDAWLEKYNTKPPTTAAVWTAERPVRPSWTGCRVSGHYRHCTPLLRTAGHPN